MSDTTVETQVGGDEITGLGYTITSAERKRTVASELARLKEEASHRKNSVFSLGSLEVSDGYVRTLENMQKANTLYPVNEEAIQALGSFLGVPVPYLKNLSKSGGLGLVYQNLDWHLRNKPDATAEFMSIDGILKEVRDPEGLGVEPLDVLGMMKGTVGGKGLVTNLRSGLNSTVIDVADPATEIHPKRRVGDVTYGGLRVIIPHDRFAPQVGMYLHRLVCSNGAVNIESSDLFSVRGMTHDDVLASMDKTIGQVWNRIPAMLEAYTSLADRPVDNPVRMVHIYAQEHGIGNRFIVEAVRRVEAFQTVNPSYKWTAYDIMQVFTSLAHLDSAKEATRNKLMGLGGHMVAAVSNEHRCDTCSHLLV